MNRRLVLLDVQRGIYLAKALVSLRGRSSEEWLQCKVRVYEHVLNSSGVFRIADTP